MLCIKTMHGPLSRATSARPDRAAALKLTPISRTSQPRPETPPVQPRTAVKFSEDAQSDTIRSEDLKSVKKKHKKN
ncbi:hypothetical protein AJ79_09793 [Helicocarpus griseus UAMH5409]|uniref:Uncharacterized protein n=1 Tax=Helicocarpus griseus UAMH5409 TaxID=1447875 RepID=A0A2B7W8W2_9EURO|nr:hypothetical protein AJ79_09793 [Helicocarpus griseus UAMH5409]